MSCFTIDAQITVEGNDIECLADAWSELCVMLNDHESMNPGSAAIYITGNGYEN